MQFMIKHCFSIRITNKNMFHCYIIILHPSSYTCVPKYGHVVKHHPIKMVYIKKDANKYKFGDFGGLVICYMIHLNMFV